MKICLINPTNIKRNWGGAFPPLGLAYLGAQALDLGHQVFVVDRDLLLVKNNYCLDKVDSVLIEKLKKERPEIVGISATTPLITDAYHCAKLVRKILPDSKIIVGGIHATILPIKTLEECPQIDIVVAGEGEITFREILQRKQIGLINGVYYRDNSMIKSNPPRMVVPDLDSLGMPARSILSMQDYTKRSKYLIRGVNVRGTSIFSSRGCPYSCSFCSGPLVFGRGVRFNSAAHVVNEIEELIQKYGVEGIYFADDMFSSKRDRAIEICDRLIERGINKKAVFCVQLKATATDEALLSKLKAAGCIQVEFGFESGSQKILDLMNKKVTVKQNYAAAALARKAGIRFLANIMTGLPGETKEDFIETVRFIDEIKPDVVGFYKLILLPGSKLYEKHHSSGQDWGSFLQDDLTENLTAMPTGEFIARYKRQSKRVSIGNAKRYFMYNLKKDPLGTAIETGKLLVNKIFGKLRKASA